MELFISTYSVLYVEIDSEGSESCPLQILGLTVREAVLRHRSLMKYILECLSVADFVLIGLATLAVSLVGLLFPKLNNLLFRTVAASGDRQLLLGITVFMISVTVSSIMLQIVRSILSERINTKLELSVQAATMMRVLSLPADFFKQFSAGELSSRTQYIQSLCGMLVSTVLNTGLSTWIYTIVHNTVVDYFRTHRQHVSYDDAVNVGLLDLISTDSDYDVLLEQLADTLQKLKEKERDLIVLHYYKGYTLKRVAEMMGMSYINAKVVHKKALSGLRTYFEAI